MERLTVPRLSNVLLVGIIAGCGSGHNLVGTWETFVSSEGRHFKVTKTYTADHHYTSVVETPLGAGMVIKATYTGDYKESGDTVFHTPTDYHGELVGGSEAQKAMYEKQDSADKASVLKNQTMDEPWTFKWTTENEFTAASGREVRTYRRIK